MPHQFCTAFSDSHPMTDFRLTQNLRTYSGGTVRDSHPVIYSPVELLPLPQALKRDYSLVNKIYTISVSLSTKNHIADVVVREIIQLIILYRSSNSFCFSTWHSTNSDRIFVRRINIVLLYSVLRYHSFLLL